MTATELKHCVDADPSLEMVEADADAQTVAVCYTPEKGISTVCVLNFAQMQPDITWAELEPVVKGVRRSRALRHMARIIGYYSLVENWGQSKLSELADRHRGNYDLAE